MVKPEVSRRRHFMLRVLEAPIITATPHEDDDGIHHSHLPRKTATTAGAPLMLSGGPNIEPIPATPGRVRLRLAVFCIATTTAVKVLADHYSNRRGESPHRSRVG
jgi:hypothetical protein